MLHLSNQKQGENTEETLSPRIDKTITHSLNVYVHFIILLMTPSNIERERDALPH